MIALIQGRNLEAESCLRAALPTCFARGGNPLKTNEDVNVRNSRGELTDLCHLSVVACLGVLYICTIFPHRANVCLCLHTSRNLTNG